MSKSRLADARATTLPSNITNGPATADRGFRTEAELVSSFVRILEQGKSCWGEVQVATEWSHPSGLTDVLVRTRNQRLVAFEAKLSDWRRAFHQAYRNASFAQRVYVLLPRDRIARPLEHRSSFELRGIGLCSVKDGKIYVHIGAKPQVQVLAWARAAANQHFDQLI